MKKLLLLPLLFSWCMAIGQVHKDSLNIKRSDFDKFLTLPLDTIRKYGGSAGYYHLTPPNYIGVGGFEIQTITPSNNIQFFNYQGTPPAATIQQRSDSTGVKYIFTFSPKLVRFINDTTFVIEVKNHK